MNLKQIDKMKTRGDVHGLIATLLNRKKNSSLRSHAARALGDLRDPKAVGPLILKLDEVDPELRWTAFTSLTLILGQDEAIKRALTSANKRQAVALIGERGDSTFVPALLHLLSDQNKEVRQIAADALGGLGVPAVPGLIAALADENYQVVEGAIGAIEKIGLAAEPALVNALKHDKSRIRFFAARCLGNLGVQSAFDPLRELLQDPDDLVRLNAIKALKQIGGAGLMEVFLPALKDPYPSVCQEAVDGLHALGNTRAVQPLIELLYDEEEDLREQAAHALMKLGWQPDKGQDGAAYFAARRLWDECVRYKQKALEPLLLALDARDHIIREGAARALGQIGDTRAVTPLISALKTHPDSTIIDALAQLGDPAALDLLIEILGKDHPLDRTSAARALKAFNHPAAVPPLLVALHDPDFRVREAAAETLVHFYHAKELEPGVKNRILAQRNTIIRPHQDVHDKCLPHTDTDGIGVNFPL
jgi:HEAT repeat protein